MDHHELSDDRIRNPVFTVVVCLFVLFFGLLLSCVVSSQELSTYVAAPDGTLLATDANLPFGDGPWPVVVARTPYDKNGFETWCRTLNQHGFACVAQDTLWVQRLPGASD